jgi:hypothetical protein
MNFFIKHNKRKVILIAIIFLISTIGCSLHRPGPVVKQIGAKKTKSYYTKVASAKN